MIDYDQFLRTVSANYHRDCKFPLEPSSRIYTELAIFFFALVLLCAWFA